MKVGTAVEKRKEVKLLSLLDNRAVLIKKGGRAILSPKGMGTNLFMDFNS